LNTKHRWSLCRSGSLNQQPEPEFLDEIGSRKPDRSAHNYYPTVLSLAVTLLVCGAPFQIRSTTQELEPAR
jgi:hypothetical protein